MRVASIPLLLALAACNTAGSAPAPEPPNAKAIILANKHTLWKDADSIKQASISATQRHLGFMWHVCVRLNAKNTFGGYTGERENLIGIYDDARPPAVLMENAAMNCDPLPHVPFPELNGQRAAYQIR